MDPQFAQVINFVGNVLPYIAVIVVVSVAIGAPWIAPQDPLATSWGMPLHPRRDGEAVERIKLLTSENAQLRAELGSVKDRLETLERIATDQPSRLARDIDALTIDKGGNA